VSSPLLLDTCAIIWIANDETIAKEARSAMSAALLADESVYVSPISAWEVGQLAAKGRLSLPMTPEKWFDRFLAAPGMRLADMTTNLLIASSFLPGDQPADPADRIIAATAREYGLRLMTRDRKLLSYAAAGYCRALAC
jgi:PIN domain nuclease of toxin-antitoxin system